MSSSELMSIDLGYLYPRIVTEVFNHVISKIPADFLLQTNDGLLATNKLILSAASPQLKEIFALPGNEKLTKVFVPGVLSQDVSSLLSLIYDGKVDIQQSQLKGIQQAARILNVALPKATNLTVAHDESSFLALLAPQSSDEFEEENEEVSRINSNYEKDHDKDEEMTPYSMVDFEVGEHSTAIKPQVQKRIRKTYAQYRISQSSVKSVQKPTKITVTQARNYKSEPHEGQFKCEFCSKIYSKRAKRHVQECTMNPNRITKQCPICLVEMKPSALPAHNRWNHKKKNEASESPQ